MDQKINFPVLDLIKSKTGHEFVNLDELKAEVRLDVEGKYCSYKYSVSEFAYRNGDELSDLRSVLIKDRSDGNTRVHRVYKCHDNIVDPEGFEEIAKLLSDLSII